MHEASLPQFPGTPPHRWPRPDTGLTRHTAIVSGQRMSYVTGGSGPPVILLHGIGASSFAWRYTLPALLPHCTIFAPDMFGCGESDKPAIDYSIASLATYVAEFMDVIGVAKADVIGHSLGGGIALQLSQLFPDRIARLGLVSTGGMGRELHWLLRITTLPGASGILGMLAHPRSRVAYASRIMERRRMRRLRVEFDAAAPTVIDRLRAHDSRRAFLRMLRSVSDLKGQKMSALPHLGQLTVPVLIIWGARDRTIPLAHARLALAVLPCAHLEILDQCFHRPQIEAPVRFNAALLTFLLAASWPPIQPTDLAGKELRTDHPVSIIVRRRLVRRGWRRFTPALAPVALAALGGTAGVRLMLRARARRPLRSPQPGE